MGVFGQMKGEQEDEREQYQGGRQDLCVPELCIPLSPLLYIYTRSFCSVHLFIVILFQE